jgi:outer membrane protein
MLENGENTSKGGFSMNRGLKIIAVTAAALFIIAALAVYMRPSSASAEGQVAGFVDSEAVLQAYQPALDANMALANLKKQSEDGFAKKIKDKYNIEDPRAIASLPQEAQIDIQKMNDEANDQYQKDMDKLRTEKWEPIAKAVNDAIKQVADEQKLQVVLEKGAVLYGGVDLTDAVNKKLAAK